MELKAIGNVTAPIETAEWIQLTPTRPEGGGDRMVRLYPTPLAPPYAQLEEEAPPRCQSQNGTAGRGVETNINNDTPHREAKTALTWQIQCCQ